MRERVRIVMVRPEFPGNIGSAARAIANMGLRGGLTLVGVERSILDASAWRLACHASNILDSARFVPTLEEALREAPVGTLSIAATARSGSASRPHPWPVREACAKGVSKLIQNDIPGLTLVFGPEADGLSNEEVAACSWIATAPTSPDYRSLNLAQAVLLFSYEVHNAFLEAARIKDTAVLNQRSQKQRLITHMLDAAVASGFILPDDPYKMGPRLEEIFSALPAHIPEAKTLHGLLDQIVRSCRRGEPDWKGRFQSVLENRNGKQSDLGSEKR